LIGATAASVILLAPRAAITAIQRITRAKTFIIIVQIIPFPKSRALEVHDFTAGSNNPTVVRVMAVESFQNLNILAPPSVVSTFTVFDLSVPVVHVVHQFVAPITSHRNISPKARAAETYTGTSASEINSLIVNFSSFFALSPSTKVSAKIGENIA
jgi:hypothetical protein